MLFPRLVCVTTATFAGSPTLVETLELRADGLARMAAYIRDPDVTIIGHNVAYDLGILAAEDPSLIPFIFAAYDAGRIRDTMIRQQLLDIAAGVFKYSIDDTGKASKLKYDLASLVLRRCGRYLPKDSDKHAGPNAALANAISPPGFAGGTCSCTTWRLHYAYLDGTPPAQWPPEARDYAIRDATEALALFESQEAEVILEGAADGWIPDERRQTRNAWAFHLQAGWGVRTDPVMVAALKETLEAEWTAAQGILREHGILRPDGTKDNKLIQSLVEADYKSRGELPPTTKKTGAIQIGAEVLRQTSHPALLTLSEIAGDLKLLSTYVPILERGVSFPCTSRPNVLVDSGRSSWSDPNWQNPPQKGGVRECVTPRPGMVFCFVDFDTAELRGLAQTCLELFGYSEMAECLKRGEDLHLALGAELIGTTYADILARYQSGDPEAADARQAAKAANFGFPGGMGVLKFLWAQRSFVKKLQAKDVTFDPLDWGKRLRDAWIEKFYEMKEYFQLASRATDSVTGECKMQHPWSLRIRGGLDYCSYANSWFQGRVADGAKLSNYRWSRECYTSTQREILGCRPVLFLHDEIGTEMPEAYAHEAALKKTEIMIRAMSEVIDRVPITAKPVLVRRWFKGANPVLLDGRLVPSKPVKDEKGKTTWVADLLDERRAA